MVAVSETWFFISPNCYRIMECQLFENTTCRHHLIRAHPLITKAGTWVLRAQPSEGGLACWGTAKTGIGWESRAHSRLNLRHQKWTADQGDSLSWTPLILLGFYPRAISLAVIPSFLHWHPLPHCPSLASLGENLSRESSEGCVHLQGSQEGKCQGCKGRGTERDPASSSLSLGSRRRAQTEEVLRGHQELEVLARNTLTPPHSN